MGDLFDKSKNTCLAGKFILLANFTVTFWFFIILNIVETFLLDKAIIL